MGGSSDQFFEATGPNDPPPNDSAGFFTSGTTIYHGANITGIREGVRGTGTNLGAPGVVGQGGGGPGGEGVRGLGGTAGDGVHGRGRNGIVGYEQTTPSDPSFESAEKAGVLGVGETGVSGKGVNGPGVHGRCDAGNPNPGVRGDSKEGPGVRGSGTTGLYGEGIGGEGLTATSDAARAASFSTSAKKAQLCLVPKLRLDDPDGTANPSALGLQNSEAGELLATIGKRGAGDTPDVASLWFCVIAGDSSNAVWRRLAFE